MTTMALTLPDFVLGWIEEQVRCGREVFGEATRPRLVAGPTLDGRGALSRVINSGSRRDRSPVSR